MRTPYTIRSVTEGETEGPELPVPDPETAMRLLLELRPEIGTRWMLRLIRGDGQPGIDLIRWTPTRLEGSYFLEQARVG